MNSFLPYGRQQIDQDDIDAVVSVLKSSWLTTGPYIKTLERNLEQTLEAKYALSCSSATAGLHMACQAIGLCSNVAIIVPALTFLASASAPSFTGAEIVFADVDPESGLLTPETFLNAIKSHTGSPIKAVVVVHLAGRVCDMTAIKNIADKYDIRIIEDACHAIGATYSDVAGCRHSVGGCSHSDVSVFSFHPVKTIAAGEGGAVTTNNKKLAQKLELFRNHGIIRDPKFWIFEDDGFDLGGQSNQWYYEFHSPAPNYRLSDINAALANSQLKKLSAFISRRSKLAGLYDAALAALEPYVLPPLRQDGVELGWHLYSVRIDFPKLGRSRRALIEHLHKFGIGSQVHYIPLPWQPYWQKHGWERKTFSGASAYYQKTLSLPLFAAMVDEDVDRVVSALSGCVNDIT